MATAHRSIATVSRLVVERRIPVDLAACAPVKGAEHGSAAIKELPERDAGRVEFNGMLGLSRFGLVVVKWCIEDYGYVMGVRSEIPQI